MTGQSSLSQQGGCNSGPSQGVCLSMPCWPSSGFPLSQEVLSHFLCFPVLSNEQRCRVTPGYLLTHRLGNSNPALPFSFTPALLTVSTPGVAARGPATSLGAPGPVICSLLLAKSHSLFCMSPPRLWLAEPRSSPSDCPGLLLLPPFLLTSPCSIPHHLLTQGSTLLPCCSCFSRMNLQDQP